jgi:alkylhydroperoxidase family enzyme
MTFLSEPLPSAAVQGRYDADRAAYGFVMDLSHVWAHQPEAHARLFELLGAVGSAFSFRERGILITAGASTIGDSYCSLAWGWKLSEHGDTDAATGVLSGTDAGLSEREAALATWARRVARSAGTTTEADVQALRDAGWSDEEVFRATTFLALRIAFSTVNAALGARPDAEIVERAPREVSDLVTWGRPVGDATGGVTS